MASVLPHALIVSSTQGDDVRAYVDEIMLPSDEIIYIDEHFNATKTSTGIYIDDIRELQLAVRAAKGDRRTIIVLQDASKITHQAQNALLKLLEEPREGLHFMLLTNSPELLLATVRSRCQTKTYAAPSRALSIPEDKAARIQFMADGQQAEARRLVEDTRYFDQRSKLFEAGKRFVGGARYQKLIVIKEYSASRDLALSFIAVSLQIYTALIKSNPTAKMVADVDMLLKAEQAIRQNGNVRLQLLRCVVYY